MPYIIAESCIDVQDNACVAACPVDCIYEGPAQLFIHPDGEPSSRSVPWDRPGAASVERRFDADV
jgi:Na+-translocating ferredoxin:NAD+ oxidoreductase RNF subunit RnfB